MRPRGIPVTLSRRGWSLLGAALGLVAGGYLLGTVELVVLGVAALALLLGATARIAAGRSPALEMTRRVRPERLHVGASGRVDIEILNRGTRAGPLLSATDWFDDGSRAARFVVARLAPGDTARAAYRVPTRRRGRYIVGPGTLSYSDPFGLARRALRGCPPREVIVRPRVYDLAAPVAAGNRITSHRDSPIAPTMVSELGDEFLMLREYAVGDDLRRVHWRSTARTGTLMVRQDEARWRARSVVVLDVRPSSYPDDDAFERAVEATASIVARLVRLRRRVEVLTSAGEALGDDRTHQDPIDRLATVGLDGRDRLAAVLARVRAQRRADLAVVVLGRADAETRVALSRLAGIGAVAVVLAPSTLVTSPSLLLVDASEVPFPTAWSRTFASARAVTAVRRPAPASGHAWVRAPAP